jgi:hypothetical protein
VEESKSVIKRPVNRRSLLKGGLLAGGAATLGAGLLGKGVSAFAQTSDAALNKGDIAILRFLAAAELIESDLWIQYAELGGIGTNLPVEVAPAPLNPYQTALSNLDSDGPQYIASNTLDEISHATFLNGYLESKGAERDRRAARGSPTSCSLTSTPVGSFATAARPIQTSALPFHKPSSSTTFPLFH